MQAVRKKTDEASASGLSESDARQMRELYGKNILKRQKQKSIFSELVSNLNDPIIRILIISLVLNVAFNFGNANWLEVGGIAVAILLATGISTLSEHSSQRAFSGLRRGETGGACRVRRDGQIREISASEAVVGDVLLLSAGERVVADGALISGRLSLEQSALTGESREVKKEPIKMPRGAWRDAAEALMEDAEMLSPSSPHSCLRGATVSSGEGEMAVLRVGDATYLGSVARELQESRDDSPLKRRLSVLARQISLLGYAAAIIIAILSLFSTFFIESGFVREVIESKLYDAKFVASELVRTLTLALTVIIMAVPEGLPMMIAVVLSSNVKKMLKDKVLVRKNAGIEAAGCMSILFTDKTGTLTEGKMSVDAVLLPDGGVYRSRSELKRRAAAVFTSICENAVYNSSAVISQGAALGGNATERALLDFVGNDLRPSDKIIKKEPFASEKKYSMAQTRKKTYFKGAPDVLMPHTDIFGTERAAAICEKISAMQSSGRRVILMCEGESGEGSIDCEMKVICAIALSDPIRREASGSVRTLREAGVGVVMITGDGLATARSVAESVGIVNGTRNLCLEHSELEEMSDAELSDAIDRLAVLARALPSDKSRLVRIARSRSLVVGMTGDGVNDAPALRASDVGFAMGDGSEIAKDAGDVIILDNRLSSIVKAVMYGRNIFKSIRKFLVFQLTMNFSSALVCMIAPLLGVESPITVTQMLWVNMIMDTLGGLAFAGEAPTRRLLREKPKSMSEQILNKYMLHQIFISGSYSVALSLLFLKADHFTEHFRDSEGDIVHLSAFFALFIFLGVMQCINSRTDRINIFSGLGKNRTFVVIMLLISIIQLSFVYFGGSALRACPLTARELGFTVAVAASAIPFELLRKMLWRFSGHETGF